MDKNWANIKGKKFGKKKNNFNLEEIFINIDKITKHFDNIFEKDNIIKKDNKIKGKIFSI